MDLTTHQLRALERRERALRMASTEAHQAAERHHAARRPGSSGAAALRRIALAVSPGKLTRRPQP